MKMKIDDLLEGTKLKLDSEQTATLLTNKGGNNIKSCNVDMVIQWGCEGQFIKHYTKVRDVYAHEIVEACVNGKWVDILYTESQKSCKARNDWLDS